jgi:ADP-heptose:LPS heptosyltransferase
VIACGEDRPAFDFHCPLLSLPLAFQTTVATIPADIPYLATLPERLEDWKRILGSKGRQRVGLVWRGSALNKNDRHRSMQLKDLIPILDCEADFFSIQKDVTDEERTLLAKHSVRDLSVEQRDFADAAAICQLLDLVITVDTAVAHLAGAIGSKVWIMLCHAPDWRWMLHRSDCPWYPTATLIRQPSPSDWTSPVNQIRRMLNEF